MDPEHKVPPEELKLYAEEGCEQCLRGMTQGRRDTELTCVLGVDRDKFLASPCVLAHGYNSRQEYPGV